MVDVEESRADGSECLLTAVNYWDEIAKLRCKMLYRQMIKKCCLWCSDGCSS